MLNKAWAVAKAEKAAVSPPPQSPETSCFSISSRAACWQSRKLLEEVGSLMNPIFLKVVARVSVPLSPHLCLIGGGSGEAHIASQQPSRLCVCSWGSGKPPEANGEDL